MSVSSSASTTAGAAPPAYSQLSRPGHSVYSTGISSAANAEPLQATYLAPGTMTVVPTDSKTEASSESPRATSSSSTAAALAAAAANRVTQACASCRRKKVRCDGSVPSCANCVSRNIECEYLAQRRRGRPPKVQTPRRPSMPYYARASSSSSLSLPTSTGVAATSAAAAAAAFAAAALASIKPSQTHATRGSPVSTAFGTTQAPLTFSVNGSLASAPATAPATAPSFFGQWHSAADSTSATAVATQISSAGIHVSTPSASVPFFQQPITYSGTDRSMALFVAAATTACNDRPLLQHNLQPHQPAPIPFRLTTRAADTALHVASGSEPNQLQPSPGQHRPPFLIHAGVPPASLPPSVGVAMQSPRHYIFSQPSDPPAVSTSRILDMGAINAPQGLFSGYVGSAATEVHGSDYFGTFPASARSAVDDAGAIHNIAFPLASTGVHQLTSEQGAQLADFSGLELTPLGQPTGNYGSARRPGTTESDALSLSLDNVAMAMTQPNADASSVQSSLDHLFYVTKNIAGFGHDASAPASVTVKSEGEPPPLPAKAVAEFECGRIHESLLLLERRRELAGRALHAYFSYIHHQCPIIHRPTFLRMVSDGTVNHFVWFALRALAARTLLHARVVSEFEVVAEEDYFAGKAREALSSELTKPSIEVVQGLALLSLYIFGTARWQEASMYWCKATRLAQLMECHVIDAPTRTIATKMHFGIFEPSKRGTTHHDDLALIPGDFSGHHVPLAQALTPLEAELRRRLWWILFTNERFCAIAERLPTMVNEARMFVHFPCSPGEWDRAEFEYQPPSRVPLYLREGCARTGPSVLPALMLGPEMTRRKADNLYMMCEIEYGFAMSHLVAFLADMGALFRPSSPYGNDYVPMFSQMAWTARMAALRANVERVERIFDGVRQDILRRLAAPPTNTWAPPPASAHPHPHSPPVGDAPTAVEIPHLHQLAMLVLYSVLNIHLYRMVFQIHYELSSSLPTVSEGRRQEDSDLMAAFDQYVKDLWQRTTSAAQHVSHILRGDHPGVPHWVLSLAGITRPAAVDAGGAADDRTPALDSASCAANDGSRRLRTVFQDRIRAQEARLHDLALSVFASFRRTLPYALLLAAKVHIDNIEWWTKEKHDDNMARAYLDLSGIVRFLETHQVAFSSTNYVSLVKGMMREDIA
ncbi:hypothetical protein GGI04_001113 [Coemansia thaxteri]|nr:hypothetical protein GGI04_001113 [Coemansia thaxteri]KAJ2487280.1 hypothetical protein EV174_000617 [Coemansia sp. RSA 2320]